jgi:hypothetical protein
MVLPPQLKPGAPAGNTRFIVLCRKLAALKASINVDARAHTPITCCCRIGQQSSPEHILKRIVHEQSRFTVLFSRPDFPVARWDTFDRRLVRVETAQKHKF